MNEPYSESELESLDAHEQQDQIFEQGGYDEPGPLAWWVWPMAFPSGARISE